MEALSLHGKSPCDRIKMYKKHLKHRDTPVILNKEERKPMEPINFSNYIDPHRQSYTRPNYEAQYSGSQIRTIELENVRRDTCFFMEPARNGISPIVFKSGDWERSFVDLNQVGKAPETTPTRKMGFFTSMLLSFQPTAAAKGIGVSPDYIKVRAKEDGCAMGISSGIAGDVFCLQAGEIPFLARPGSFILCEQGVSLGTRPIEGSGNAFLISQLGYRGFLVLSGQGLCFLQGGPQLFIRKLGPGQSIDIYPRQLLGMSGSVSIAGTRSTSPDLAVRRTLGSDYELTLQADSRGGVVCVSEPLSSGNPGGRTGY